MRAGIGVCEEGKSEGPRRSFSAERRSHRRQTPRVHGPRERRQIESQIESSLCGASQNKFAAKITFIDSIRASERDPIGEPNLRLAPLPFLYIQFLLATLVPSFRPRFVSGVGTAAASPYSSRSVP
ncbi:hypothetical protein MRX96_016912 [Rhipicephalus microplus]